MKTIHKWSFDGDKSHVSKASVLYTGDEKRICDGCDETTKCTTIKTIGGTLIVCEDCVRGILECFEKEEEV